MRGFGLGAAWVAGMGAACTVQPPGQGSPGTGGTSFCDAAFSPAVPDSAAGTIVPPDASAGPVNSAACWASSLPPPVQPIPPHTTVMDACAVGAAAASTDWAYPKDPAGTNGDERRYLVGRWAVCSQSIFGLAPHAGIEFGANGRWRMLALDATTGALVPMDRSQTTSGTYDMLGSGQLDLAAELGGGATIYPVTFTAALDAINFNNPTSVLAFRRYLPSLQT